MQLGLSSSASAAEWQRQRRARPTDAFRPEELLQQPGRRWYPVIDYSRCTNCMECIDFCLFGVYGVDTLDRILVENQDNCKKGCPACSRVCPEQAIMFPDYKTPAIAGAPVGNISGLKIDLTKLFGGGDAMAIAAQERDRELVADGREAVGLTVGIPKRQENKAGAAEGRSRQADGFARRAGHLRSVANRTDVPVGNWHHKITASQRGAEFCPCASFKDGANRVYSRIWAL